MVRSVRSANWGGVLAIAVVAVSGCDGARRPASQDLGSSTLTIGDEAPPLQIAQWLNGPPIDTFQAGRVYVVEFWATWCPPCRASMPHLSQLQQQLGQRVTIIGVSNEDEATVQTFLGQVQDPATGATWDQIVTYAIALDSDGATFAAYMEAAGQRGIPTAFVVGTDGRIAWIGHPMALDQTLSVVLVGT